MRNFFMRNCGWVAVLCVLLCGCSNTTNQMPEDPKEAYVQAVTAFSQEDAFHAKRTFYSGFAMEELEISAEEEVWKNGDDWMACITTYNSDGLMLQTWYSLTGGVFYSAIGTDNAPEAWQTDDSTREMPVFFSDVTPEALQLVSDIREENTRILTCTRGDETVNELGNTVHPIDLTATLDSGGNLLEADTVVCTTIAEMESDYYTRYHVAVISQNAKEVKQEMQELKK